MKIHVKEIKFMSKYLPEGTKFMSTTELQTVREYNVNGIH